MTFRRLLVRIVLMMRPESKAACILVLANTVLAILSLIEPLLLGKIIDTISVNEDTGQINYRNALYLFGAWSFLCIMSIYIGIKIILNADQMAQRLRLSTIYEFTNHALRLPASYYDENLPSRTFNTIMEGSLILWNLWFSFFRENCASVVLLILLSPVTLIINWKLALPLIITVFFTYCAFSISLLKAEKLQVLADEKNSQIMDRISDLLTNVKLVAAYDRVNNEMAKINSKISAFMDIQGPLLKFWSYIVMTNRGASMSAIVMIFAIGIWLKHNSMATIGEIVGFSAIAQIMMGRLDSVGIFISTAIQQKPKIQKLIEVLDTELKSEQESTKSETNHQLCGDIVFDGVSFKYPDGTLALKNISFIANQGTVTAIVGKSGSGKTTLANLLCKFYEPTTGKILINQIPITDISNSELRKNIGILFQDHSLLQRSFEENVKFGSETKSWPEIEKAMRSASVYDVYEKEIIRLNTTGNPEVTPHLSGGERQRLALARILLKNPPIIILDEPTSAIDSITEKLIQDELVNFLKGKTAFIIAHRLSTIMNADQIIVMNDGEIIESDTFDQLAKEGTFFSKLLKYQISISHADQKLLDQHLGIVEFHKSE